MSRKNTKEDIQNKLNNLVSHFKVLTYSPGSKRTSTFYDSRRDLIFEYKANNLLQKVKRNKDFVPKPSDEERRNQYREGAKKRSKTFQTRYGVEHPSQLDKVKSKKRDTCLNKYGVSTNLLEKNTRKKAVTNASKIESREKARATIVQKYVSLSNPEIYEKRKSTSLRKYGKDNPAKSAEVKNRTAKTCYDKGLWKKIDNKSVREWADIKGVSVNTINVVYRDETLPTVAEYDPAVSSIEAKIRSLIEDEDYSFNKQLDGSSYRPDFVIPEKNLIIECDGLYWHSDAVTRNKNYHLEKKQAYSSLGYDSLFFREDEINDKIYIVDSIISNKFDKNTERVFARKCKVQEVGKEFIERNHLMGKGQGRCFALVYEDDIVAAIQVKWISLKDKSLDVSRFCSKPYTSVIGGFSKLVSYVENLYYPKSVRTFIDLRYGSGEYLSKLGFSLENTSLSFKWTDFTKTYGRMTYRSNTGYDYGLRKIWDCGQVKWVKYNG